MNRITLLTTLCLMLALPGLRAQEPLIRASERARGRVLPPRATAADSVKTPAPGAEPEGPANKPLALFTQIESDYDFGNDYFDVLSLGSQVFEDQNARSGYYYYFPKEYQLSWSPVSGYAFGVNYLSADAQGQRTTVLTLQLEPNISREDVKLAGLLVRSALKNRPGKTLTELQSIPLAEPSKISFKRLEGLIDPRDVEISVPSDFLDPIVLLLKTERPDDLLALLFTEVGLRGELTIFPAGEAPAQVIPVTIKLDYHKTFGTMELTPAALRAGDWTNPTSFPLLMKNLHLLRLENRGGSTTPVVYTWQMGNKEVPEKGKARINAASLPAWLDADTSVRKIWIEYAVVPCYDCNQAVQNDLLGGTTGPTVVKITFDVVDPLSYTGAVKMRIKVRSTQLDPNGRQKIELNPSLSVVEDGVTLENVKLFVPKGQKPQFEYAVSLTMDDGTIQQSGWITNNGADEIGIGRALIKTHFPDLANRR